MTASDADLVHLFGIKKPFLAPLYLSYPLNQARRLSADEAAQLCERDSAIKPSTRDSWEIAPPNVNGVLHANLSKMSRRGGWHAESTWVLPVAPGEGMLRLSAPLGSGRALSKEECRQLRSIGGEFKAASPSWTVKPAEKDPLRVLIFRYQRDIMYSVGTLKLAPPPPRAKSSAPNSVLSPTRPVRQGAWQHLIF
jgi:hypothetical protein